MACSPAGAADCKLRPKYLAPAVGHRGAYLNSYRHALLPPSEFEPLPRFAVRNISCAGITLFHRKPCWEQFVPCFIPDPILLFHRGLGQARVLKAWLPS